MFDWVSILFNSLAIVGAALTLAIISYAYWLTIETKQPFFQQWRDQSRLRLTWFAIFLILIGLAGTSQQWWEGAMWLLLAGLCLKELLRLSSSTSYL